MAAWSHLRPSSPQSVRACCHNGEPGQKHPGGIARALWVQELGSRISLRLSTDKLDQA
jgi:hypothetical protein